MQVAPYLAGVLEGRGKRREKDEVKGEPSRCQFFRGVGDDKCSATNIGAFFTTYTIKAPNLCGDKAPGPGSSPILAVLEPDR